MKPMFWTQPHSLTEWTCIIRSTKEKLRHISHNIIKCYVWKESSLHIPKALSNNLFTLLSNKKVFNKSIKSTETDLLPKYYIYGSKQMPKGFYKWFSVYDSHQSSGCQAYPASPTTLSISNSLFLIIGLGDFLVCHAIESMFYIQLHWSWYKVL